jgi:hypothetical protein
MLPSLVQISFERQPDCRCGAFNAAMASHTLASTSQFFACRVMSQSPPVVVPAPGG